MGFLDDLFGGDKKTKVSSVAYNLAGDEAKRPDYLKTLVLQNVLSDTKNSISQSLSQGYLKGPGIRFRSFFRWANRNDFDPVGMPTGRLDVTASIDLAVVEPYITVGPDQELWIQDGQIDGADYGKWIEQYLLKYYPAELENDWTADIDEDTGDITITFEDTSEHTFTPVDYRPKADYLYVYYSLIDEEVAGSIDEGDIEDGPFPDVTDYTLDDTITDPRSMDLTTTVLTEVTYSDATPPESDEDETVTPTAYDYVTEIYKLETYLGTPGGDDVITKKIDTLNLYLDKEIDTDVDVDVTVEDIGGGVMKTTTVTTTTESLIDKLTYRADIQLINILEYGPVQLFIYRIGSGITDIDDAVVEKHSYGKFFPFLPMRLKGTFISNSYKPNVRDLIEESYHKLVGADYEDLVKKIRDNNDNLSDIDYAYIVLGVALNTDEKFCKKYLWLFFLKLMAQQDGGPSIYTDWVAERQGADTAAEAWVLWRNAQSHPGNPLYGTPQPSTTATRSRNLGDNRLRITNTGDIDTNYDVRIRWTYITTGAGAGRYDNMKNDGYRFEFKGEDNFASTIVSGTPGTKNPAVVEKIRLYHQINAVDGYEYIDIVGLVHHNIIYKQKEVKITAKQGLKGQDEETGFIIPLHYETFKEMSLVDSTQMTTSCLFVVFNCYETVKIPWYQTGFFKVLLVVVIAIAAALFTAGVGAGILGANLAVGTSLGFSGTTAAIVGSVTNALAAVALSSVLTYGAQKLFGDTIGIVVGVIASIISINALTTFSATGSLALNWSQLMSADNLLKLGDALSQSYAAYVQGNIEDMAVDMQAYVEKAENTIQDIQQKLYNEFGYGIGVIDPLKLMESRNLVPEPSDTFLKRTLMTGTDIADMSNGMLSDFASLTLDLPNPYS